MKTLSTEQLASVVGGFHLVVKEDHLEEGQTMIRIMAREGELSGGFALAGGEHFDDLVFV